jgi:hypothetical protein
MDFKKKTRTVWGIREAFYYLFSPETPKQIRDGILTLFNPETPKTPKFWIFDRPVSSMYCKYAEYACKLQKIYPT